MKKLRTTLCLALALLLAVAVPASAAQAYYYEDYTNLLGSMEIVNVQTYTSMRDRPTAYANKIARVPAGAVVTNCYYYDDKYTYCEYGNYSGYIANANLSFIAGPVGYEYPDEYYLGNFMISNCASYASLRVYPDTNSQLLARVPLGEIVTNVFYQDDRFSYCVYGDMDGYILNSNLTWVSGGSNSADTYGGSYDPSANIGTAVIVNCVSYASLRQMPDTRSARLAKVPLGAAVYNAYIVDDRFAYCEYNGIAGYILIDNLGW
ncbi:MAG: SH3 domain-containing protein [Clostridia bacterium]|nr:SH3 domain-containing protein [Clostridia bacterium]